MVSCGDVLGVFEIVINENTLKENTASDTIQKIKKVLEKFECTLFMLRYKSKELYYFKSSGAEIGRENFTGTLGAIAESVKDESSTNEEQNKKVVMPELVALFSNHVAIRQNENKLFYGQIYFADILKPNLKTNVDIAVAVIHEQHRETCKQEFKTQKGTILPCVLVPSSDTLRDSAGEFVHIWGAKSKPGRGIIHSVQYGGYGIDGCLITIRNRDKSENFAMPGDSGSVVCKISRNGKELYALGMLIGGDYKERGEDATKTEKKYVAFEMQYGIENILRAYGLKIEWIPLKSGVF